MGNLQDPRAFYVVEKHSDGNHCFAETGSFPTSLWRRSESLVPHQSLRPSRND